MTRISDLDAELALLAAILIDNSTIDCLLLSPANFYATAHGKIFEAILDLIRQNSPADLVTVANRLQGKGQLEEIGGAAYLARILDFPMATNPEKYAAIIRGKSQLRKLSRDCADIIKRCSQGDPTEVLEYAEKQIFAIRETEQSVSVELPELIQGNIDLIEMRQSGEREITGIPTGFKRIDKMLGGLQRSDLMILAARPGQGKTALALNIAMNLARNYYPSAIFSLEMPKEQLSMRMIIADSGVDSGVIRSGQLTNDDWARVTDSASRLTDFPITIDDSADLSELTLMGKARRLKNKRGIELIIVDYIQLMRSSRRFDGRKDLEIGEISRALKIMARQLNIPVIALSQLNRKLEERTDKRPKLSDLRESGSLEQDADVVAFIYRDEVYNKDPNNPKIGKAEVIIEKQRNGPTGVGTLRFFPEIMRFQNLGGNEN